VVFEKTSSDGNLQMASTLTGTADDLFNDASRLPKLYLVQDNTVCTSLPATYSAGVLTTYTTSPATKTDTIEDLAFSDLDTSCLIILRAKTGSRSIDDRFTTETVSSDNFDIIGSASEPAIETPTTTTVTTTTTTTLPSESCCAGNACEQLKEVLKIENPSVTSVLQEAVVPSPDPVSNTVGETDSFPIMYPLVVGTGPQMVTTQGQSTNLNGLRFLFALGTPSEDLSHQINPTQIMAQGIGAHMTGISETPCENCRIESMALSILDFNTFRSKVEDAINILDGKIREILAVQEPTCP